MGVPPVAEEVPGLTPDADVLGLLDEKVELTAKAPMIKKKESLKPKPLSLFASNSRGDDLKTKIATLEADVAMLKSKTSTLENMVNGERFDGSFSHPSSLQKSVGGSSLKSRIVSLEDEIDILRSRMTNLEHIVEG